MAGTRGLSTMTFSHPLSHISEFFVAKGEKQERTKRERELQEDRSRCMCWGGRQRDGIGRNRPQMASACI